MKISVIIPCFNEINTIEKILHRIRSVDNINFEIIVVDDFSTDGTRELLQSKLSGTISSLVLHDKNFGKGASFRTGLRHATGDIVLIQDADLEYSPEEYPKLLQPILDGHADVVYGSRFRSGEATRVLYYWHSLGNKFLTGLSNIFTDFNLTDMETCYKVFRNEVIKQIKIEENRFGFEPEITA